MPGKSVQLLQQKCAWEPSIAARSQPAGDLCRPALRPTELGAPWFGLSRLAGNLRLFHIVLAKPDCKWFGGLNPGHALCDLLGCSMRWTHGPEIERIIDDANHAGMLVRIEIQHRLVPAGQLEADGCQVILVAGQEEPSGPRAMRSGIAAQHFGIVLFRLQGDRVEAHVTAHTVAEQLLGLGEIAGGARPGFIRYMAGE